MAPLSVPLATAAPFTSIVAAVSAAVAVTFTMLMLLGTLAVYSVRSSLTAWSSASAPTPPPSLPSASARALRFALTRPARVVTENSSLTPPIVTVALTSVAKSELAVTFTATVCPLVTVFPLKADPSTSSVPPEVTEIGIAAVVSSTLTVIASLVSSVPGSTPVTSVKLKLAGVVLFARVTATV